MKSLTATIVFIQLSILSILQFAHINVLIPNIRIVIMDLGVSYSFMGVFMGIYIFLSGVAALAWSLYSDLKGVKRKALMAGGITASGILSFLSVHVSNPYIFAFLYVMAGMSISVINVLALTIIIDFYQSEERTEKLMVFKIMGGVGYALGFALGIFLGARYNNWKYPIFILSILILCIGLPLSLSIIEPPKGLSEKELTNVLSRVGYYPFTLRPSDIKIITGNKSNIYITLQGMFGIIAAGSLEVWIVQYLVKETGANEVTASIFLGISVIGALGGILISHIADDLYKKSRKAKPLLAGVCSVLVAIFFIVFLLLPLKIEVQTTSFVGALKVIGEQIVESYIMALAFILFFIGMIFSSSIGSIRNSVISDVNLPEHRATVISGINIAELFSKSIGVALVGILIDVMGSIRYPLILAIATWFISGYFWFMVARYVEHDIWKVTILLEERVSFLEQPYMKRVSL